MEQKDFDIYEILKGIPDGTPLYTPMCGKVEFRYLQDNKEAAEAIITNTNNGAEYTFNKNGKYVEGGEVMLFPSKEMRDWSKFVWKKGDVLVSNNGKIEVIFERFRSDTYQSFVGRHHLDIIDEDLYYQDDGEYDTFNFNIETEDAAQSYINTIEERLGGKLNRETLEIEKAQSFKDGDIVSLEIRYIDSEDVIVETYIVHGDYNNGENLNFYTGYRDNISDGVIYNSFVRPDKTSVRKELLRYATEEEKQQLFSALSKENKAWDANKKLIVNLKPAKLTFKIGKLYVFDEEDEDGNVTVIGELIGKYESNDTLTFGNQYEIENEKFVTDQAFDLRISSHEELREATENEIELFEKHYSIWEKGAKEQPEFKPFDKVLVRNEERSKWQPAFFVRDLGEEVIFRFKVLPIQSGRVATVSHCIPFEGNENIAFTDYDENLSF